MRLLITSDIHYNLKQFDWLCRAAADADAVIIAGDLLDLAGHVELDAQIAVARRYLEKLAGMAPTFACSGNHDGDVKNGAGEFVAEWLRSDGVEGLRCDGDSARIDDSLTLTACPWWDGPVSFGALERFLESEAEVAERPWGWLYHAPPHETALSWTGKQHFGDAHLGELIARFEPDWVFGGHVHNAPYRDEGAWALKIGKTWCFNPGMQWAPTPCHIVLDTVSREAQWFSDFDVETRVLD